MFVFLKYLMIKSKDIIAKTDEINETGSPNDNLSIIGSEISMSSNNFRIRPLMMKS